MSAMAGELVPSFNQSTREAIVPDSQAGGRDAGHRRGSVALGPLWLDL